MDINMDGINYAATCENSKTSEWLSILTYNFNESVNPGAINQEATNELSLSRQQTHLSEKALFNITIIGDINQNHQEHKNKRIKKVEKEKAHCIGCTII